MTGTTEGLTVLEVDTAACTKETVGSCQAPDGVAYSELDSQFTVWWEEPEDQDRENPRNWSPWRKWTNIITISVISFVV
jgi:hypothetical protein